MKNFLEVKEFDSIICNEDYKDDLRYKFLNKSIFDELINLFVLIQVRIILIY